MSPDNRRRIGEGVALTLYFVVDAYEVWPQSHSIALLVAIVGASAILFAEWSVRPWLISTAVLCVAAAIAYVIVGPAKVPEVEITGSLQPGRDATPANGCGTIPPNAMLAVIGDNGITSSEPTFIPIQIGECPITIERQQAGGVFINAEIFDAAGKEIGRIVKNSFSVLSSDNSYVERRGDLNTLAIYNGSGEEIFYVRYVNANTVRIRGVFTCPQPRLNTARITDTQIVNSIWRGSCFSNSRIGIQVN